MKKVLLSIVMMVLLLCSACSSPAKVEAEDKVTVAGTWYSVLDATMYNFNDGEITAAGVTVGQYEDNGDSAVVSMMSNGKNIQLYITQQDGVDVLADVQEGEGNIYFCKGLENAKEYVAEQNLDEFEAYISENLCGIWENIGSTGELDKLGFWNGGFLGDRSFPVESNVVGFCDFETTTDYYYWIRTDFVVKNGETCAEIQYAADPDGSSPATLTIIMTEKTLTEDQLYFDNQLMQKEN